MIKIQLKRFCSSIEQGTFGRIQLPEYRLYTVELPWLDNKPNVSCIPPGTYKAMQTKYFRGNYPTFELVVPKRSMIKFHIANSTQDLLGCIGLGLKLGWIEKRQAWAVLQSKKAMEGFMSILGGEESIEVEVLYVY